MERVCYSIKDAYILEIVFFFFVNHNTNTLGNFEEHTHIHKVEEKIYIYQQINQGNLKGIEMGTTYNFCITANHDESGQIWKQARNTFSDGSGEPGWR